MKQLTPVLATALLAATLTAQAADVARTATASTPPVKATSSPTAKPANNKPGGATPAAGGSNSGSVTDGSNTGTQVKPKVPKCPDPNETACAAAKVKVK